MIITGLSKSIEDLGLNTSPGIARFTRSTDGQYLAYQSTYHKISFYNAKFDYTITIDSLSTLGRWNYNNHRFVFYSYSPIDASECIMYNVFTNRTENLFEIESQFDRSLVPFFSKSDDQIIYRINGTDTDEGYTVLWSYDIKTKEQRKIFSFADIKMSVYYINQVLYENQILLKGKYINSDVGIFLLDITSGEIKELLSDEWVNSRPVLSPDKNRILFESDRTSPSSLWLYDLVDNTYHQLTDPSHEHSVSETYEWKNDNEIYIEVDGRLKILKL